MSRNTKWTIDPSHSEIAFKIRHLMISYVRGTFKTFDATIHTDGNDFSTAEIDFWMDPNSISTGDEKRDEHLRGADFFDAANHKEITFRATSIERSADGMLELWGDLTVRGITKNIRLEVTQGGIMKDPWGKEKAGFSIKGKIKRDDWQLTWNAPLETGGVLVGGDVIISCDVELVKAESDKQMKAEAAETDEIPAEE